MALKSLITIVIYLVSIVAGSGLQSYATAPSGTGKINSYGKNIQEYSKDYGGSHMSSLLNEDYNSQSLHAQISSHNQMVGGHVPLSEGYDQHIESSSASGDVSGGYYPPADMQESSYKSEMWQSAYPPSGYSQNVHSHIQQPPQIQYYEAIEQHQPAANSANDLSSHQQYTPDYSQHYTADLVESQQKYNQHSYDSQHDSGLNQQYQQQEQLGHDNQHQVDVINYVPVPVVKKLHVPYQNPVQIPVSHTVIIPVPKPVPIHIPIPKQIQIPVEKELKIPVERLVPYPVEKKIPYPVEKRVPFQVVKYVPVKVHKPYPIKVPVVKTVLHKVKGWW